MAFSKIMKKYDKVEIQSLFSSFFSV